MSPHRHIQQTKKKGVASLPRSRFDFEIFSKQTSNMIALPTEFPGQRDQKAFTFKIVKRECRVALLEKHETLKPSQKPTFEVVIVRELAEKTWPNGITTPAREGLPPSENWGVEGWSYETLEKATLRYERLKSSKNA